MPGADGFVDLAPLPAADFDTVVLRPFHSLIPHGVVDNELKHPIDSLSMTAENESWTVARDCAGDVSHPALAHNPLQRQSQQRKITA
jgi:hypothetical protein